MTKAETGYNRPISEGTCATSERPRNSNRPSSDSSMTNKFRRCRHKIIQEIRTGILKKRLGLQQNRGQDSLSKEKNCSGIAKTKRGHRGPNLFATNAVEAKKEKRQQLI